MKPDDASKPDVLRAAIVLDDWKLPVFRKRLEEAGYEYRDHGPLTRNTTTLTVQTTNLLALKSLLDACEAECRKSR